MAWHARGLACLCAALHCMASMVCTFACLLSSPLLRALADTCRKGAVFSYAAKGSQYEKAGGRGLCRGRRLPSITANNRLLRSPQVKLTSGQPPARTPLQLLWPCG